MKKTTTINNQRGISLLEVLVAMILMAFSLLLTLNMAMVALDGNYWSNNTTKATQLLQEKLEQLRAAGPAGLKSGSDTTEGLIRSWRVSKVATHLKQIDVQIKWEDIQARTHTDMITSWVNADSL
ncbi:MAG: type IV pilus modification PilV family protein [Planctomycetota bacterium]|jgi:Tfp pilus assembly protein PilV